jgi:hypothetical protein
MAVKISKAARNDFSERSTGSKRGAYYETKGHAINAFDTELQIYDLCLDRDNLIDFNGDEGRKVVDIHNDCLQIVGIAVFSWYRMASGRYEFIGYIA